MKPQKIKNLNKVKVSIIAVALLMLSGSLWLLNLSSPSIHSKANASTPQLYWFIPDGLRAEPSLFQIYTWANQGLLPNIKRLMDRGSYGYSIPVFPGHTPVNFATLFTGVLPKAHGVADGPIRLFGYPLKLVSQTGFSSAAKLIDPIWFTLEQAQMFSSLISVPGSTPPEVTFANIVNGRWGNWGVDFPSVIFHSANDHALRKKLGVNDRVFTIGKRLTQFVEASDARDWNLDLPKSYSPLREVNLNNWEADLFVLLLDQTDDQVQNYDLAILSKDKKESIARLKMGDWSPWFSLNLNYSIKKSYVAEVPQNNPIEQALSKITFATEARLNVIRIGEKDEFRFRLIYEASNESLVQPLSLYADLKTATGPMVDYVDNYPPQLIYDENDKKTFIEEANMSFDWHSQALDYFLKDKQHPVIIQNIYTPNQMLTSRWWMGAVDPKGRMFDKTSPEQRKILWSEVQSMYQQIDKMIGQALDATGDEAYIVLSSDHGATPLNTEVRLNNLFAKKGWLKFSYDENTSRHQIDWKKTKVIFLNMDHVYINPQGLDGNYYPTKGAAYEKLRSEVRLAIENLTDNKGVGPLDTLALREDVEKVFGLPANRVGDIVIANKAGFNWVEDMSDDLEIFVEPIKSGYKQAVLPHKNEDLWTPFIIAGPNIKQNYAIQKPISHLQQYPTIMKLLGVMPPHKTEMSPLDEIFVNEK